MMNTCFCFQLIDETKANPNLRMQIFHNEERT